MEEVTMDSRLESRISSVTHSVLIDQESSNSVHQIQIHDNVTRNHAGPLINLSHSMS